jgi:hypothetical protein
MKLPSLHYLAQNAARGFLRFPFTLISALVAVIFGVYMAENHEDIKNIFPYLNGLLTALLGIPLFFCVAVFSYSEGYARNKRLLLHLFALLVLVVIYFTLPDENSTRNTALPYIRYAIYAITVHLLVAFIPFLGKGQLNGFWQYNRILFVRFLTSVLYSGVLFAGLSVALNSLRFLFDIDIKPEVFLDLFIVIGGLFNTWFFVSGIPDDFKSLDGIIEYPKGIRIFSQYILLPLIILYLLILYIYAGKIVALWNWPKGIVSYLIACVAVFGILNLLLIHPYGNLSGNSWIRKFSRAYYFILFPLVVLLFIAIAMRVADYGITINRYIIILLGVWLTIACVYFGAGRTNIKFIPVSLALIIMLVSFGPWGMFSVSERSQVKRLHTILEEAKVLENGKIQREVAWHADSLPYVVIDAASPNEKLLTDSLHNEVKSILDYLDDFHGVAAIRDWYSQDIDSIIAVANSGENPRRIDEAKAYMETMGLEYQYRFQSIYPDQFTYGSKSDLTAIDVRGYDYFFRFNKSANRDSPVTFQVGDTDFVILSTIESVENLTIASASDTIVVETAGLIEKLVARYGREYQSDIPQREMQVSGSNDRFDIKIQFHSLSFNKAEDSLQWNSISGDLLLRRKQ